MTITQLKYFLSICEFGKIRIASERLHVSEPTISVSIKRLEEELGVPLFIRNRKQLSLTNDGKFLQEKASEVVGSFDRLEAEIQQSQKKSSVIRIATPSTLGEYLCSRLISEFVEKYPSALFGMPSLSSIDAAHQVENEQIELAICDQLAVTSKHLVFSPIIRSMLFGYVHSDNPLAGKENVSPQMLKDEKLILLSEKATISLEVMQWFHDADIEPNLFMYSNRTSFSISMVKRHNAVAFFLDGLLAENEQLRQFPPENRFTLNPPLFFNFGIIRKKGANLTKEARRFYDFCRQQQFIY